MYRALKSDASFDTVKKLLDDGFDVNKKIRKAEIYYSDSKTLIYWACEYGSEKIFSLLLSRGAEVDRDVDIFNQFPLHIASRNGHAKIVRELLLRDKNPNWGDEHHWTPLHHACYMGRVEVVVEILKHLSKTPSKYQFPPQLKDVKKWWSEGIKKEKPLSSFLSDELVSSLKNNLSTNCENNEKGKR